jgi:ribonuclease HI
MVLRAGFKKKLQLYVELKIYDKNRRKITGPQCVKITKAFCTTSNEALCIVADTTPIILKIEEAVRLYNLKKGRGNQTHVIDREVDLKHWQHPADDAKIIEADDHKDQLIHAYTDGSKTRNGVRSGVAIFFGEELALQEKFKLDNRCTNNQAEQLAITKALEAIGKIDIAEGTPRTATIFTDSRVSIESIKNNRNHNHLIKDIRKKITSLERANWNIKYLVSRPMLEW